MRHHPVLLLGLLLLAAAAGCDNTRQGVPPDAAAYDYRLKHPLAVEPRVAVLRLARTGEALAAEDGKHLDLYAAAFIRRGDGPVEVSVGAVSPADAAARAYAQQIAGRLLAAGLKTAEIRLQLVIDSMAIGPGAAVLRFDTTAVQLPDCPDWSDGPRNAPSANFGCAIQRNLGAMVSNPRDLVEPAPADGSPARRNESIDRLNQGTAPWSVPLPWGSQSRTGGK